MRKVAVCRAMDFSDLLGDKAGAGGGGMKDGGGLSRGAPMADREQTDERGHSLAQPRSVLCYSPSLLLPGP